MGAAQPKDRRNDAEIGFNTCTMRESISAVGYWKKKPGGSRAGVEVCPSSAKLAKHPGSKSVPGKMDAVTVIRRQTLFCAVIFSCS